MLRLIGTLVEVPPLPRGPKGEKRPADAIGNAFTSCGSQRGKLRMNGSEPPLEKDALGAPSHPGAGALTQRHSVLLIGTDAQRVEPVWPRLERPI